MLSDCLLFCPRDSVEVGGEIKVVEVVEEEEEEGRVNERNRACSKMFPPVAVV